MAVQTHTLALFLYLSLVSISFVCFFLSQSFVVFESARESNKTHSRELHKSVRTSRHAIEYDKSYNPSKPT